MVARPTTSAIIGSAVWVSLLLTSPAKIEAAKIRMTTWTNKTNIVDM